VHEEDSKTVVKEQFVTTGASRGDQVSILKGVGADDVVVTAGQLKLHNGSAVKIDNTVQPTENPMPAPQDH
jgi:membrane fusion protein, multidrug efflux system